MFVGLRDRSLSRSGSIVLHPFSQLQEAVVGSSAATTRAANTPPVAGPSSGWSAGRSGPRRAAAAGAAAIEGVERAGPGSAPASASTSAGHAIHAVVPAIAYRA